MDNIEPEYLYKVYRQGNYLGLLKNVVSKFGYSQDINTVGSQINIEVGQSADISDQPPDPILDETGDPILDETGDPILAEQAAQVVGNSRDDIKIRNGNVIEVWEYNQYYPNGRRAFVGTIKKWSAKFGGAGNIGILVYFKGDELGNYLVAGSPYVADVSQTTQDDDQTIYDDGGWIKLGQTWTVGAGVTNLAAIDLRLLGTGTVTVKVYNSVTEANSGAPPLATIAREINDAVTPAVYRFTFTTPIQVTEGGSYFMTVETDEPSQTIFVYYEDGGNVYAGGALYVNFYGGGSGGGLWTSPPAGDVGVNSDLYFVTYSSLGATTALFEDFDPTEDLVQPNMDNYISAGGAVGYDDADIEPTGVTIDEYTFITATLLEMLEKALELSPSDFYYAVDLGELKLRFKQAAVAAEHFITKGRHVNELDLSASTENIKNKILFIGGLVLGSNLYREYKNVSSIDEFGLGLDTKTDNRVTVTSTADQIGTTSLDLQDDEQYQTEITLLYPQTDISQYKVGQMLGFNGFGPLVDSLLLQIVRVSYSPESVTLSLGVLPPRTSVTLARIERKLEALQTVDNPDTPS